MKHSRVISIDAEKQFDKIKHLSLGWEIPWRRNRLPTPLFLGFPGVSAGKGSAWQAGHLGSIPGFGRSPGEGNGNSLQYSCLQKSLTGYSPWGCKELDTTERLSTYCEKTLSKLKLENSLILMKVINCITTITLYVRTLSVLLLRSESAKVVPSHYIELLSMKSYKTMIMKLFSLEKKN